MPNKRKGFFTYNGRLQSITNILKEPGVVFTTEWTYEKRAATE